MVRWSGVHWDGDHAPPLLAVLIVTMHAHARQRLSTVHPPHPGPNLQASSSVATPAFAYIRVKRRRATVFLKVDPAADTVAALLGRLSDLLQQVRKKGVGLVWEVCALTRIIADRPRSPSLPSQPAADMRLVLEGRPLADADTLADAGVVNDAVVAVVFRDGDALGGWEPVDVEEFDVGGGE